MKSNKGFTLIELLAVIVILAIIALIATPIILNIINDSRASARVNSAKYIVSTLETAYATSYMLGDDLSTSGTAPSLSFVMQKFQEDIDNVEATTPITTVSGEKYSGGYVIESKDGITCLVYNESSKLKADCYNDDEVNIPSEKTEGNYAAGSISVKTHEVSGENKAYEPMASITSTSLILGS